jgi:hypothetical protein
LNENLANELKEAQATITLGSLGAALVRGFFEAAGGSGAAESDIWQSVKGSFLLEQFERVVKLKGRSGVE